MSVRSVAQAGLSGVGKRPGLTAAYDRSSFPGNFELISRVEVGAGGAASIEFAGIPSTFSHLQIRGIVRNTGTSQRSVSVQFNSDTGSNYAFHLLYGNGGSAGAENGASQTGAQAISQVFSSASANIFSAFVMDILDYSSTSKNTTIRTFGSRDENGAGLAGIYSGLWNSTSAVTSVKLYPLADNFAQYSRASLYGVIRNG